MFLSVLWSLLFNPSKVATQSSGHVKQSISLFVISLLCWNSYALAEGLTDPEFNTCKQGLSGEAEARGFSQAFLQPVFNNLIYRHQVIKHDRSQAEYVQSPFDYVAKRVNDARIRRGQKYFQQHADYLRKLTRQYGVPGQYLIAFWGLETNFGSYIGKTPVFSALATLACDRRRSHFFRNQFFAALELLERDQLELNSMVGSWAGAMGQTQFMPSVYLKYGVDGDGDGRVNLWSSPKDALASAANYLRSLGWRTGEKWGREVRLPKKLQWQKLDMSQPLPLRTWHQLGLKMAIGSPLPALDMPAQLMLPLGVDGPAFLTYPNFRIIMRWNRSSSYGLAVGYFADRIAGQVDFVSEIPVGHRLSTRLLIQVQQHLIEAGLLKGKADGILGPASRQAIRDYQRQQQLVPDGYPGPETLKAMSLDLAK